MAELLKRTRITDKSTFTRSVTKLLKMIDTQSQMSLVDEQYTKVKNCYEKLETTHNEYLVTVTDIDIETSPQGIAYMADPDTKYEEVIEMYATYQKEALQREAAEREVVAENTATREKKDRDQKDREERDAAETLRKEEVGRQVEIERAQLTACIEAFERMSTSVKDLDDVSSADRRSEFRKVEKEHSSLKQRYAKLLALEPTVETEEIAVKMKEKVDDIFHETQRVVLELLKDSPAPTSGGVSSMSSSASSSMSSQSSVKKEPVRLPKFKGDPKLSPYLRFPVWKSCWDKVIAGYDEEFRVIMLHDNVDEFAKAKYAGHEQDYEVCMEKLVKFYGDPVKVVSCVVGEVMSSSQIREGDYKSLLQYSVTLETNFNRLTAMGYEHEMSNTTAMTAIVRKFPQTVAERWHDHLSSQTGDAKVKPFPLLISWLSGRKETWESMVTMAPDTRESNAFYNQSDRTKRHCFRCGDEGHLQRNCPDSSQKPKNDPKKDPKKPRKPPKVKKYWCALHKDDPSRRCFSDSCQELRRLDPHKRLQLLIENEDCSHCCGDHKLSDCSRGDRVCGGGKSDRGCKKNHKVHELFCVDAKVFATACTMPIGGRSEGVMLLIMQVRTLQKRRKASVFFDAGSDSNFVNEGYAEQQNFKGSKVNLCVRTLGGEEKNFIEVMVYTCVLVDLNGERMEFEAFGMKTITDSVTQVEGETIQRLFPHLSRKEVSQMMRSDRVDFLIGMYHASWHPSRAERADGGGDLWVYRSRFGACVGGRHPEVREGTQKSKNLFVKVHQSYHVSTTVPLNSCSHELDYCPRRVENYYPVIPIQDHAEHYPHRSGVDVVDKEDVSVVTKRTPVLPPPAAGVGGEDDAVEASLAARQLCSPHAVPVGEEETSVMVTEDPLMLPPPAVGVGGEDDAVEASLAARQLCSPHAVPVGEEETSVMVTEVPLMLPPAVAVEGEVDAVSKVSFAAVPTKSVMSPDAVPFYPTECNSLSTAVLQSAARDHGNSADSVTVPLYDVSRSECAVCLATRTAPMRDEDLFFRSQLLGTMVQPRCGGCKCSKCPIPGMKYSFKEQQEYDLIQNNLFYKEEEKRWYTEYPWATDRNALPRNEKAAFQSMLALERRCLKDAELGKEFCTQIQAMVERNAAIILTEEEVRNWEGDYHYLSLLGVKGKKGDLRVVFNAARRHPGYPSMNDCLMKGPDKFMNNGVLPVLLGFRNGRVAAVADLRKFHNQVKLVKADVMMQLFKWRNLDVTKPPDTYAVCVNNFGVKPANCIATSALHKSADLFSEVYPVASQEIKEQLYVDDELVADASMGELKMKTQQMDEISEHAGMKNKGWTYSKEDTAAEFEIGKDDEAEMGTSAKVLGMSWHPKTDNFHFQVQLELKTDGNLEVSISTKDEWDAVHDILLLTRRILLSNVSRIFDPLGFLTPILLESKLLMRESWCGKEIGWDDPLPYEQGRRWLTFLSSLLSLEDMVFERSLWPEEEVVGLPTLIIFSDGSALAFGACAYIRWKLASGGYWTRLIMSKCRVAPKTILSIPRMELNGAVIGNRIKNFLVKETNMKFEKVYQIVDSSTILGYIQKECGVFKPYEGVRVAEIQVSLADGNVVVLAWVPGIENPSDWCTKPRTVKELLGSRFWREGSSFLHQEESTWPLRFTYKKDNFDGELKVPRQVKCLHVQVQHSEFLNRLVNRTSSWQRAVRTLAWILRLVDSHHVRRIGVLQAAELAQSRTLLIKFAQRELIGELEKAVEGKGRFKKLCPVLDQCGVWRVGSRMRVVPFTLDAYLPALLPHNHRVTLLVMEKAHQHSHLLQDGTVARFRCEGFWTVRCGHLAKKVVEKCVDCRKVTRRLLTQQMGEIPEERLQNLHAWGYCQMDLFGPYMCRSDVNARSSKKTWGIVIEDSNSGAVHLDVVSDYSAQAVISSLHRFGSLRGWPGVVCTDPGSQLESAGGQLDRWWSTMGDTLRAFGGTKNFSWKLSPADSPWRQGKAERRIAIIKKLLTLSFGDARVTPLELQTSLMEIANICNERPIGLSAPRADGTYQLITPNQLLLGRSVNILPDNTEVVENMPMSARFRLVHHISTNFWKRWSAEVSPGLVVRQKWHVKSRNIQVGDLVLICEASKLKAKYKLGVIDSVAVSRDEIVHSAVVRYVLVQKNTKGDFVTRTIRVTRSVQRLILILPIEEQSSPLTVIDDEVQCAVQV